MIMVHVNFKLCVEAKGYIEEMDQADVTSAFFANFMQQLSSENVAGRYSAVHTWFPPEPFRPKEAWYKRNQKKL